MRISDWSSDVCSSDLFMAGGLVAVAVGLLGGVDTGWTFYTPYSSTYASSNVILMIFGAILAGFSSILTGINFIVTTHTMRAPGMPWFRSAERRVGTGCGSTGKSRWLP